MARSGRHCTRSRYQRHELVAAIGHAAGFIGQGKTVLQNGFDILEAALSADSDVLTV